MNEVVDLLERLRSRMRDLGLTHYLVPGSDEHQSEYLPERNQRRQRMSGFHGSAGDLLVGLKDAWMFTDGRYHLQADRELQGTTISLSRVGRPQAPTLLQHLQRLLAAQADAKVGVDPRLVALKSIRHWQAALRGMIQPVEPNLVDLDWHDRPAPDQSPLIEVPLCWSGADSSEKLRVLRARMHEAGADALVVCKLDQLGWLLNLRALGEVPFNPVFEGFAWIDRERAEAFIRRPEQRVLGTRVAGWVFREYSEFRRCLESREPKDAVWIDPVGCSWWAAEVLKTRGFQPIETEHPVDTLKAVKNAAELGAMENANRKASAALVRALLWLEVEMAAGRPVTEASFRDHLESRFKETESYFGLSFASIVAAGENGAIVHYKDAGTRRLRKDDLLLIDCGIHACGGTTDATRTVSLGSPTNEQRSVFTSVLRAHISAAGQTFPAGTSGLALDALCRAPLWQERKDYDHGTGHGVGSFLNVHEGPFAIAEHRRRESTLKELREGMITSIEPGYYLEGWGGVRLENLYRITAAGEDAAGRIFLRFDPLTFIPFDRRLIDREKLTEPERRWLDDYHARTDSELEKELTPAERAALHRK